MTFDEFQKKLEQMDFHIRSHSTGSPEEFSEKLNISRSTFFKYREYLEHLGEETIFDKVANTYKYKHPVKLQLLQIQRLDSDDMNKLSGGKKNFYFFDQSEFNGLG